MILVRFTFLFCLIIISSCNENCINLHPSLDNNPIELKFEHLDADLFSNQHPNNKKHQLLLQKYTSLYELFYAKMLNEGNPYSEESTEKLTSFLSHPSTKEIQKEIITFSDFTSFEDQITKAFNYYNYYYPDSILPVITTFYSNFNANVIEINNRIAIGVDMYLGSNNKVVNSLPPDFFPLFIKNKMLKEFIVSDVLYCFLYNRYYQPLGDDFISEMIAQGKILYFIEVLNPDEKSHLKFRYTQDELTWCLENEENIWETVVNQQVLYSKDANVIKSFSSDSPYTKGLPKDSPAKVGPWLGYQIVKDYVEANCIDIVDLQLEKNVRQILKSYHPNE